MLSPLSRPRRANLVPLLVALHWRLASDVVSAVLPSGQHRGPELPLVVVTWATAGYEKAADVAFDALLDRGTPLDAVVAGCSFCERERCDGTVGYGGSPDELGETTLDAMVMDGGTMQVGAVGQLRGVRDAVRAAQFVMEHTEHTLLVGESASEFAVAMGLGRSDLTTPESAQQHTEWVNNDCQPNFWVSGALLPDPARSCGPYRPTHAGTRATGNSSVGHSGAHRSARDRVKWVRTDNHDTIAAVVIGSDGSMVSGTSTNGARNKLHGRVGDSPIPGAGSYVRAPDGGCGGTGDGDIMMRFLPCYQAVESMSRGMSPRDAAIDAIGRISKHYPDFGGAIVVVNGAGEHSAACSRGLGSTWSYAYRSGTMDRHAVGTVDCL